MTAPAPTVTGHTDAAPCPRVEVLISPMPVGAASVTVWRSYAGRREPVRGAVNATVAGDFYIVDYEPPLGWSVTYTCQTTDTGGGVSGVSAPSAGVVLDVPDVWASDPLMPALSQAWATSGSSGVVVALGGLAQVSREAVVSRVATVGSPLPIGMSGVRQAASGVPLRLYCADDAAFGLLTGLLDQAGGCLCLRVPPTVRVLPPVSYLQVGSYSVEEVGVPGQLLLVSATADSVRGPGLGVIVPVRTWADVAAEAASWADLLTHYDTWLDLLRGTGH